MHKHAYKTGWIWLLEWIDVSCPILHLRQYISSVLPSVPSWIDWDALPQRHAFISEALRWRPVMPLGNEFELFQDFHG